MSTQLSKLRQGPIDEGGFFHIQPGSPALLARCAPATPARIGATAFSPRQLVSLARQRQCWSIVLQLEHLSGSVEYLSVVHRFAKVAAISVCVELPEVWEPAALKAVSRCVDALRAPLALADVAHSLEAVRIAALVEMRRCTGVHLEVVSRWHPSPERETASGAGASVLATHLGTDVPWHLHGDITAPGDAILKKHAQRCVAAARAGGLRFVYCHHAALREYLATYCHQCGAMAISRDGQPARRVGTDGLRCLSCDARLPITPAAPSPVAGQRRAVCAGSWYEATSEGLAAQVHACLRVDARRGAPRRAGQVRGLVVPHAGLPVSGKVAGVAYASLCEASYDIVVIMAPSHQARYPGLLVPRATAYTTPLGAVPIDRQVLQLLEQALPMRVVADDTEHAVEVQLPFLQTILRQPFTVVPLVFGQQSPALCRQLCMGVQAVLSPTSQFGQRRVLLIASTDLSHFRSLAETHARDRRGVELLCGLDPAAYWEALEADQTEACGYGPAWCLLELSRHLGAAEAELLAYTTSVEATNTSGPVVGYAALAIW